MVLFIGFPAYNDNRNGASLELKESEDLAAGNNEATIDENRVDNGES